MRRYAIFMAAAFAVPAGAQNAAPDTAMVVKAGVDAWSAGDFAGAVKAWQGPAAKGDADAQFNLAQAYKLGRGVPVDLAKAEDWYRRAALQGHLQAGDNYGLLLFQSGRREQALPWITQSAGRGEARAQYILGIATFNGDIVGKDWVRAYALMTRAAAAGVPQAREGLASMDTIIPLEQRQMGVSLAGELERQAQEARAREVAAAELGTAPGPLRTSPAPAPIATAAVPPSTAGTAPGVITAGADFANPVVLAKAPAARPAPKPAKRVVGSYVTGAPAPAPAPEPVLAPVPAPAPATSAQPAVVKPKPVPAIRPAAASAPAPSGRYRIQFGAFGQKGNADALWNRLKNRPELAGRSRFDVMAGTITRLQAGPFASEAEARQACARLSAISGQCVVVMRP
jgi:TPR repeat protein